MAGDEATWRLVEARCSQLADSVASARVPFLLALTWSFVWAWALYGYDLGYLNIQRERYEGYQAFAQKPPAAADQAEFQKICAKEFPALGPPRQFDDKVKQICTAAITERFNWAEREYLKSTRVS